MVSINDTPAVVSRALGEPLTTYADKQLAASGSWVELLKRARTKHSRRAALSFVIAVFYAARVALFWPEPHHAWFSGAFAALGAAFCWRSWRTMRRIVQALGEVEDAEA